MEIWKQVHLLCVLVIMETRLVTSVKITSDDAIIGREMEKDAIEKPIIDHLNNLVVFRPIGVMYPTMTFGHLRSTIDNS